MAPLSADLRRKMYREGKRLVGAERMRSMRSVGGNFSSTVLSARQYLATIRRRLQAPLYCKVQSCIEVDYQHVLIAGRIGAADTDCIKDITYTLEYQDGRLVDVTNNTHRYIDHKAIIDSHASCAFIITAPCKNDDQITHIIVAAQQRCQVPVPASHRTPAMQRVTALLDIFGKCKQDKRALLDAGLGDAITGTWASRQHRELKQEQHKLQHYNVALAEALPRTTVIIPLYGRCDFLEHQLAHFVQDAQMCNCEILYVLDDPTLASALEEEAAALAKLHPIAFSVLYLQHNRGYAGANNAAAGIARGENLLLLNSDVFPAATGWLDQMFSCVEQFSDQHIIGARLLYNDNTVQHDGMRFESADNFDGLWLNRHPGKGLPNSVFSQGKSAQPREAVTGACMLVSKQRFLALGGLDEAYILGDFEDSDFCMKARQADMQIVIAPQAVLYHLERQSQTLVTDKGWKSDLSHYNCWLHTSRWHDQLVTLKEAPNSLVYQCYG